VTIGDGRGPDIIYHSCLTVILLITAALLLRGRADRPKDPGRSYDQDASAYPDPSA
jgi:hypothetical protein